MINITGKKAFFINPPNILKDNYLEYLYKNEYELYLLNNTKKVERLLEIFERAVLLINIDVLRSHIEWIEYISELQRKYKYLVVTVFTKSNQLSLRKTLLMDLGIKGGVINLYNDNWNTIKLIEVTLKLNEARERRKYVRVNFDKNKTVDIVGIKVFTSKGYLLKGKIKSFSSAGLLAVFNENGIDEVDCIENIIFSINNKILKIEGSLYKHLNDGECFISFENILEEDKSFLSKYIFDTLQNSFLKLLKSL